jgi:hypothetical protein
MVITDLQVGQDTLAPAFSVGADKALLQVGQANLIMASFQ